MSLICILLGHNWQWKNGWVHTHDQSRVASPCRQHKTCERCGVIDTDQRGGYVTREFHERDLPRRNSEEKGRESVSLKCIRCGEVEVNGKNIGTIPPMRESLK